MTDLSVPERDRLAWWVYLGLLAGILALIAYKLVGSLLVGLFLYYGTRPIYRRVLRIVRRPGIAASLTLLITALPGLIVVGYLITIGYSELAPNLSTFQELLEPYVDIDVDGITRDPLKAIRNVVQNPSGSGLQTVIDMTASYVGILFGVLQTLFIAFLIAFYLLRDHHRIHVWFRDTFGKESTVYGYATAVDRDLETIYSSNVLLVLVVAILAAVFYNAYNMLAPTSVAVPYPTALAILTGIASLVPLVVGKLVYVPLTAFLAANAFWTDPTLVVWPVGLFVVAFLFLDFIPLTFVLPKIAGRQGHVGLIMFGYIIGVLVFGWYGLFFGPLLVVLVIQAVRIVLTELVQGRELTPIVRAASGLGSDPKN